MPRVKCGDLAKMLEAQGVAPELAELSARSADLDNDGAIGTGARPTADLPKATSPQGTR